MAYRVLMIYPSGNEEFEDEIFETYEEAVSHGEYACSCFEAGGEILDMCGEDFESGEADFEVVKV